MKRIKIDDLNDVNRQFDNLEGTLRPILKASILDGRLITGIVLTQTLTGAPITNNINHGLGRTLQGWIVMDKNATDTSYRVNTDNADRFLNLAATTQLTINVWVF